MNSSSWEPLPADVAEWMGMDEAMVPFVLDLADADVAIEAPPPAA